MLRVLRDLALPPGPCRHCEGPHWNRECTKPGAGNALAAAAAAAAFGSSPALAEAGFQPASSPAAAEYNEIQGWLASTALAGPSFLVNAAIVGSGATHHMSGRARPSLWAGSWRGPSH